MEDEEEVIMALVDSLPRIAECIGGCQFSPVILESMEMLFMVDNEAIVKKVKDAIKTIYAANKEVLKFKLIEVIDNFWKTEENTAREMCLYFYGMMIDDLTDDEKATLIKTFSGKFKKEPLSLRMGIIEALSNQKSAAAILNSNFLKPLGDDIKSNVGNNNYMASVKSLFIGLLQADDPEINSKIFAIIREVDKGNVRPFFKPSVIIPIWAKIVNKTEEDKDLYDADFVWKKLSELQVEKDKEDNLDPKESRIRKEIEIFNVLIENLDLTRISEGFFTSLPDILGKDEFFMNLYLKYYWNLEDLALKEGENNALLKKVMLELDPTKIREKTENLDKIITGLKSLLKGFNGSAIVPDVSNFLQHIIDLALVVEDWRDRVEVVDILLELAKAHPKYFQTFKKNYLKLILDPSFETRKHAVMRFIELLELEGKKGSIDTDFVTLIDMALGQKSCFKRCVALTIVEVNYFHKRRCISCQKIGVKMI